MSHRLSSPFNDHLWTVGFTALLVVAGCNSSTSTDVEPRQQQTGQQASAKDTTATDTATQTSSTSQNTDAEIEPKLQNKSFTDAPSELDGGDAQPPVVASDDDLDRPLDENDPDGPFAKRRARNETVWKNEVVAQEYEQALVQLWDRLLAEDFNTL